MVHQPIDQEDAATARLEDIGGIERIRDGPGLEAGARISNYDDWFRHSSLSIARACKTPRAFSKSAGISSDPARSNHLEYSSVPAD